MSSHRRIKQKHVLSGLVLLFLVVTLLSLWSSRGPESNFASAYKLAVLAPNTAKVGEAVTIMVRAVDDQGRLDARRNDIIRISLNPEAKAQLNTTQVALGTGEATVTIIGVAPETVTITASWLTGYGFLKPSNATITFHE